MKPAATGILYLFLLAACSTAVTPENWPELAPPYHYFREVFRGDEANRARQSEEEYLGWVRRFYEGRRALPSWQEMTESLSREVGEDQRLLVQDLGFRLGRRIAAEWAKDNAVRRIDTGMLSLWGSVILSGDTPGERLQAMLAIDRDTRALLDGSLPAGEITEDRYPGLDSFF